MSQQGFHLVPVNVKKDPWENHALGLRSQSPIQLWISVLKQSLRLHKMPWLSSGLSVTNVVIIIDIIILLILPATVPSGQHSRHTALKPRPPFSAGNTGHLEIGGVGTTDTWYGAEHSLHRGQCPINDLASEVTGLRLRNSELALYVPSLKTLKIHKFLSGA